MANKKFQEDGERVFNDVAKRQGNDDFGCGFFSAYEEGIKRAYHLGYVFCKANHPAIIRDWKAEMAKLGYSVSSANIRRD